MQAAGTIGTGVITARIRNQPTVFSDPVIISTAKLKPGVETLSDAQVVFPFPNVPSNVDLKGFKPDETSFGTQTMIGGFAEGEIAALYENVGGAFRYGVVLRGAAPSDDKLLVGAGGAEIAGRVIKSQTRGNFVLVQLELPSLTEVFDEYSFKIDSAKLGRQGTLRQFKGQIKQKAQNRQAAGSANEGLWDCTASAGVQFVGSSNPPSRLASTQFGMRFSR